MTEFTTSYLFDLLKVIVPIIISAVVGNYLIQRWQQRNWRQQQLVLRGEKGLEALKLAIDDLMQFADARSYRSRRLLLQLRQNPGCHLCSQAVEEKIKSEYIQSVVTWNEKFNSMCVRLTMYAPSSCARDLEFNIQPRFVEVSSTLEWLLKTNTLSASAFKKQKESIIRELDGLNGAIGELCKDLIRALKNREKVNYLGEQLEFNPSTIDRFSTWQLIKALFISQKPTLTVFGPSHDIRSPSLWGN